MTDHEADCPWIVGFNAGWAEAEASSADEIATLHQEATQLRARIKRLEAALINVRDIYTAQDAGVLYADDSDGWEAALDDVDGVAFGALLESGAITIPVGAMQ